jgi:hypothetical protein
MAIGAGFRSHCQYFFNIRRRRMPITMAIIAGDIFREVATELPVGDSTRSRLFMASDTILSTDAGDQ